ncbi:AAA family ATPase [Thomasclavelia cocleata]|uniref:AAA family ATPase n=1 Tax=Thomasclavelia cocleata TaxID=69824 RepID=UPI00272EA407|nr:AAA family ATPase [Thomasclavelia cocleata]
MSEIQSTEVEWLWYPYIPLGKLTIIQGDPGSGKTMLILYIASLLSTGSPLPTQTNNIISEPMTIIYQTSEDGYDDTIKPRLEKFKQVDFNHIVFIKEDKCSLTMLDERIEKAIIKENAKLLVLDPIQAYIGQNVDMNRANEMRPLLKNLMRIAQSHHVAIVLVGHMNKGKGSKSSYRNLGRIDIPAAARSVLICGELKNEDGVRAVIQDKSSLAQRGKPFAFKFDDDGFQWLGEYDIDADELLDGFKKTTDKDRAKTFLQDALENGPIKASEMYDKGNELNFSKRTLDYAKAELNVQSFKKGKIWYWKLN